MPGITNHGYHDSDNESRWSRDSSRYGSQSSIGSASDLLNRDDIQRSISRNSSVHAPSSHGTAAGMLAATGVGQTFTKGMIASSAVTGTFGAVGNLIEWGIKKDLMSQQQGYHQKNMKLGSKLTQDVFKNNMASTASYYKEAGIPYLPGGVSVGNSSLQYTGNNYRQVNNHTAGIKYSGTQAQQNFNMGSFL